MPRALVTLIVLGVAGVATAQPANQPPSKDKLAEGAKLFELGRGLAKTGKYEEACEAFRKSLAIDPASGTLLNLADCNQHLGHLALAWRQFEQTREQSQRENNPSRADYAHKRAEALKAKLGTIVIELSEPGLAGLTVTVAGESVVPAAQMTEVVDPGDVAVHVAAPGHAAFDKTQAVAAGATVDVAVTLQATASAPGPGEGVETPDNGKRRRNRLIVAYALGGAGGVAVISGFVLGYTAKRSYDEQLSNGNCTKMPSLVCNPDGAALVNSAGRRADTGTVIGLSGLALLAAGAVVYFTAPKEVVVTPVAAEGTAGLSVIGQF